MPLNEEQTGRIKNHLDNDDVEAVIKILAEHDRGFYDYLESRQIQANSNLNIREEIENHLRKITNIIPLGTEKLDYGLDIPLKPSKRRRKPLPLKPQNNTQEIDSRNKKHQLRNFESTRQILEKMTTHVFVSFLETRLSRTTDYWRESNIIPPLDKESYAWWFCFEQARFYDDLIKKVSEGNVYHFIDQYQNYFSLIRDRNKLLKRLCGSETDNFLFKQIRKFETEINQLHQESVSALEPHLMNNLRSKLVSYLGDMEKILRTLSQDSMDCVKNN